MSSYIEVPKSEIENVDGQNMELQSQDPHTRHCPGDVEIPNRVFVKGFSKETSEEDLINFFEIYGIVHDAKIVRDKLGMSKGYAFVTFDSQSIAEKVREEATVPYKDRDVIIGPAKMRPKRLNYAPRPPVDQYGYWQPSQQQQPTYYSPDGVNFYQVFNQPPPQTSPYPQQQIPVMTSPVHYQVESYQPQYQTVPQGSPSLYSQIQVQQPTTVAQSPSTQILQSVPQVYTPASGMQPQITSVQHAYPLALNSLTQAMNSVSINDQFVKVHKPPTENIEYQPVHTQPAPQSPVQVVPMTYEGGMVHSDEVHNETQMHPNIVFLADTSKLKTVHVFNNGEMPKHIHTLV